MKRSDFLTLGACVAVGIAGTKLATRRRAAAGRLRQSVVHAGFERRPGWQLADTIKVALELGCVSVEGLQPPDWEALRREGLQCACVPAHGWARGMNNPVFWDENLEVMHQRIDQCAEFGFPNVLGFTGLADTSALGGSAVDREAGRRNCIEAFRKATAHAERKGVTLLLAHLNSRAAAGPNGHPGYQGDDLGYCAEIVRAVGSPRMKLLFDVYQVQVMHGDLLRSLEECRDILGHVRTGGSPGRCEIGPNQEINYMAIVRKLAELGYAGYLGHAFTPTGEPREALREAVAIGAVA